jgi:alkylation response protein AidB-like acyl-CoA dehydrogenase
VEDGLTSDAAMDLTALRDGVRDVLDREVNSERLHRYVDAATVFDEALWAEAAGLGWPALTVPEAYDGLGLGMAEAAVLFEEVGRALAPLPLLGTWLAGRAIELAGSDDQKAAWLPRIASGELPAAFGPKGDDDVLEGGGARLFVIDHGDHFLVREADASEVTIERTQDATRHFARLTAGAGDSMPATDAVRETLHAEAGLALACDAVGGANVIFDRTVEYLKVRQQFGKPIGSFQALKHRCADHKVALVSSGALVAEAVRLWAAGDPQALLYASTAKASACDVYAKVAEDAVQLHGGIGFTWEHDCHLFLKRAKLNQALFGSSPARLDDAARRLVAA